MLKAVTDSETLALYKPYEVERSLFSLPAADNIASNFAEEWRFHISFTSQVKIQPLERTTEGPDLQWGHSTVC